MNNTPTYLVIEIQTAGDGTATVLPISTYLSKAEAMSAYYSKCALAVISNVPVHTVQVETNRGFAVACECFEHEAHEVAEEVIEEA